jgi:serine/threonine protein kinase
VEISDVRLAGRWSGWVAVRAAGRERFSKEEWEELLKEPEKLLEGAERTLKDAGNNTVVIKYLATGGKGVRAVLKRHRRGRGVRELFRGFGGPKSMRNFIAAVRTSQYGLPVAAPLAALHKSRFGWCSESIYISEYAEGVNLYEFIKNMRAEGQQRDRIIRQLMEQMAEILGGLHEKGLYHRDAKATNFVVTGRGQEYHLVLTDMDGIKQYFGRREESQMRPLWRLASSVMDLAGIKRTDYLRMFREYCDRAGIPEEKRRGLLRELAGKATAKFKADSKR